MTNKITVSTSGKRISLDIENADAVFWQIVGILQPKAKPPIPQMVTEFKHEQTIPIPIEVPKPTMYKGYGFLYIKCEHCGDIKGFNTKQDIDCYFCKNCGGATAFTEPLAPVRFTCECGSSFKYLTNIDDDMFDINCLDCHSPVTVEYNGKVGEYRGVKE